MREDVVSALSVHALASQCLREINNYRRGEPYIDTYGIELLRRATIQGDQDAWASMQRCFSPVLRSWLRDHPSKVAAYRLKSEEHYIAQALEQFWQATAVTQQLEFNSLASALQYLHACLNGAILDTLRAHSRPGEVSMPEPGTSYMKDNTDSSEVWESLKTILPNEREQRMAYLLFHCGLKPVEIVRFCPQEYSDIHEIYSMRRSIVERVLHNANQLRWQFRTDEGNREDICG